MARTRYGSTAIITATILLAAGCQTQEPTPAYDGQTLFNGYCAACHGPDASGNGPMVPHLATPVPDLRTLSVRNDGMFPRERIVSVIDGRTRRTVHGTTDMPVWGYQFRREEGMTDAGIRNVNARIDALVGHIESIQVTDTP